MDLALSPATAQSFYAPQRRARSRDIPLGPEMLEALPEPLRRVVRGLLRGRSVRAYLVRSEALLTVEVRNRRTG